jgi:hypothetical protein
MSKQQQKQRKTSEPSGDDEAENRKRPFRAPAMLSTIRDYVDRFDGARKELNHKEGKKFNIDTFQRQEADYRELHGFCQVKPVGQTYDGLDRGSSTAVSQTGVSIAQVLSPANYFFFVDPESPFDGGFSVHSLAAQQVAIKRGFREVNFSHLSAIEQIPHRAKKATAIETIDLPPPSTLRLPEGTLPNLFRHGEEPYAVSLVRAFEDKFVDPKTKIPYSPCRLWTPEARQAAGHKSTGSTGTLHSWCYGYYAVRAVKTNVNPSDIKDSLSLLRKLAAKNKPNEMPKGGWLELASTVANNYLESNL